VRSLLFKSDMHAASSFAGLCRTAQRAVRNPQCWLMFASFVFLYLHLFVPAFTPIWTGGDALIWLHDAHRMLYGQALYRDFVQITLPATDLLYFVAFKIFGPRMWIANVLLLVLGMLLVWLSYRIAMSLRLDRLALLPPLLLLTLVYRDRLDASHHWFSTLATIAALAVLIDRRTPRRVIIAGALCGLAACFTQSAGAMAVLAFAVFLYWEHRTQSTSLGSLMQLEARLILSSVFVVLIVSSYFAWRAGLARFIYCTVIFNLRYYGSFEGGSTWRGYMTGLWGFFAWPRLPGIAGFLLVHLLIPLVYILFFVRYIRRSRQSSDESWDRLMLVAMVGVASLLSVGLAPTWARLYYVSLPGLILFVWILKCEGRTGQFVATALQIITLVLTLAFPIAKQLHQRTYLDLPSGYMAFLNQEAYEKYRWAQQRTKPGDFFFGGPYAEFYFLLDLRDPSPVPFITPFEYTRPEEVQSTLDGLETHKVKFVLWAPALDLPEDRRGDHLAPLRAYLRSHYHVGQELPEFEVWVRNS
jgi:hypothetical protein